MRLGFEKFVFESIAHDPSFNLAEADANRLFGMENNVASHFFGRYLHQSCTQAISQIPPERRKTFFTAVTMFFPVVHNAETANMKQKDRGEPEDNKIIVARVLKNLDQIEELEARGELTFKNLARLCVPELPKDSKCEFAEVGKKIEAMCGKLRPRQASSVMSMVSESALGVLRGGLSIYGIEALEHSACDFTLSKNERTGEILIRYSSPEELPFSFEWTATVGLDGSVTSTPMRFTEEKTRNALREF